MSRIVHVLGNGDSAHLWHKEPKRGLILTCNLPPFPVPGNYAACIVDFKFMHALTEGILDVGGQWILGYRPKIWMDKNPEFYMKRAKQVKEFYTVLPPYAGDGGMGYTNFSCGHMAVHYAANKVKADEVHMYGFDSMFDFNLNSCSDFYLSSVRDPNQNNKLSTNWRPVWTGMFNEFSNTKFVLHHTHNKLKMPVPDNVSVKLYKTKQELNAEKNSQPFTGVV